MEDDYDGINYDPDNLMGDHGYGGGDDDTYIPDDDDAPIYDMGDDDGGDVFLPDDDDGGAGEQLDPLDDLENCWLIAKSADAATEEQISQLNELVRKETEYFGKDKTKFGFRATRLLLNIASQEGRSADVQTYFKTLTTEYKTQLKESRHGVTALLEKLVDSPNIVQLCDDTLAFTNDIKNRVKLMLLKARGLVKNKESEAEIEKTLNEAHGLCQINGVDDVLQSSALLDIYALKMAIAEERGNLKAQKTYFDRSLPLTSAGMASNCKVTGSIFRCGGRVRLFDSKFGEASGHFCEAFKNFDEGRFVDEADECLKLWVFSSLLSGSPVNPFDDQRASVYLSKTAIKNIERLVRSSVAKNIDQFLRDKKPCLRDETVARFVPALERKVQKLVIVDMVQPYSNISLPFIAKKIMASEEDTENLLVEMVLDSQVAGRIDQTAAILHLRPPQTAQDEYYEGVRLVSSTVAKLQNSVLQAVS